MRKVRFSLRYFLVLITAIAVAVGIMTNNARKQQLASERVFELGGVVQFDYLFKSGQAPSPLQAFLAKLLGDHMVYSVRGVVWHPGPMTTIEEYKTMIDAMKNIERLQGIAIWPREWMDSANAKKTATLLEKGGITDEGVRYLLSNLESINHASLMSAQLTNASVQRLVDDRRFQTIQVNRVQDFGGDRPIEYLFDLDNKPIHWTECDAIVIPAWRPHRENAK